MDAPERRDQGTERAAGPQDRIPRPGLLRAVKEGAGMGGEGAELSMENAMPGLGLEM